MKIEIQASGLRLAWLRRDNPLFHVVKNNAEKTVCGRDYDEQGYYVGGKYQPTCLACYKVLSAQASAVVVKEDGE